MGIPIFIFRSSSPRSYKFTGKIQPCTDPCESGTRAKKVECLAEVVGDVRAATGVKCWKVVVGLEEEEEEEKQADSMMMLNTTVAEETYMLRMMLTHQMEPPPPAVGPHSWSTRLIS